MAQFIAAIGLVLVIEGLLFAAFPRLAKRLAASALESPETSLRVAGIASAVRRIDYGNPVVRIRAIPLVKERERSFEGLDVTRC